MDFSLWYLLWYRCGIFFRQPGILFHLLEDVEQLALFFKMWLLVLLFDFLSLVIFVLAVEKCQVLVGVLGKSFATIHI